MNEAINQLYTGQKRLASRRTWIYLLVRLVRHCVSVQWLAITLVEIQFARKSTQGFHSLATKPKPTRVEWHPYIPCYSFTATYKALKYIPVFFLLRLACTFDETSKFVWSYNASLYISSICGYLRLHQQNQICDVSLPSLQTVTLLGNHVVENCWLSCPFSDEGSCPILLITNTLTCCCGICEWCVDHKTIPVR